MMLSHYCKGGCRVGRLYDALSSRSREVVDHVPPVLFGDNTHARTLEIWERRLLEGTKNAACIALFGKFCCDNVGMHVDGC